MVTLNDAFSEPVIYLHSRRDGDGRLSWQAYRIFTPDGQIALAANMFGIPKDSFIFLPHDFQSPVLKLKSWRFFPFNGKYDVLDCATGQVLGAVKRNGAIFNPQGDPLGRMVDPTPVRSKFGLGLVEAVFNAMLGQGDSTSSGPGANRFELQAGSRTVGTFRRMTLPFAGGPESERPESGPFLKRIIPAKFWKRLHAAASNSGWELSFSADADLAIDPRLRLAAALFRIELERRFAY
ncbi:MAG TPA: hypothetical protein VJW76_00800 [Verrucomicrobiae bacterium]|nr:hypothetical protein [Verrucomicrobiae bacterium]